MASNDPNNDFFDDEEGNFVLINNKKLSKRTMWSKNAAEFLNGVTLSLDVSFGYFQTPIRKNVYFVAEDTLIFLSGKHIIEYDIIRKKETYLLKNLDDEQIVAMNYYMNKKKILSVAVALKSTTRVLPQVKIYSKAKNFSYSLVHAHLSPSSNILDVSFFMKSKYLLCLLENEHKYQIAVWHIAKEKMLAYIDVEEEISKICLSPINNDEFSLSGKHYLKVWNFNPNEKNLIVKPNSYLRDKEDQLVDHCWIPNAPFLVIITTNNEILNYKHSDLIQTYKVSLTKRDLDMAFSSNMDDKPKRSLATDQTLTECYLSCVCATSRGFACGVYGAGMIVLFEIDKAEHIIHKGNFKMKDENIDRIHSLHTSPDDMYIAVSVIYTAKRLNIEGTIKTSMEEEDSKEVGRLELSIFNVAVVDAIRTAYKDPFEPLFEKGVHKGNILNISTTPTRSIFASLGEDKYVKFWEFGQEFKGIFSEYFHEIPLCLCLHPLSIQVAIGFREGVRVFYVLDDVLRFGHYDNVKDCSAISYSDGGNLLAASNHLNNHFMIHIYNSYTFDKIMDLDGHAGFLREILWSCNDTMLISSCSQGILFCWILSKGDKDPLVEHACSKQYKYNAVTYDIEWDLVVACCADSKMRLFAEKGVNQIYEYDTTPYQFTSVMICKKMNVIFFGTNAGSIRVYLWPIYDVNSASLEFIEFPIHQGNLTNMKITADFQYLITSSEDSSIFMSKIREYADGHDVSALDMLTAMNNKQKNKDFMGKISNAFSLNAICLTSKTSHDAKKEQIKGLDFKITNLKGDIEDEKDKMNNTYNQRIKTEMEKNRDTLSKQKESMKLFMEESDRMQKKLTEQIENQRVEHKRSISKEKENNSRNLLKCYERSNVLTSEIDRLKNRFNDEKMRHQDEYNKTLKEVEGEYQEKYQELYNRFSGALANMKVDQRKFDEVFVQSEEEFEKFLEKTKVKLEKELEEEDKIAEDLRTQFMKLGKDNRTLKDRLNHLVNLIKDVKLQISHLEDQKLNFSEKIKQMMKQLEERERIINIKEEQIKEFRSKNIHLQNFRSVYDYRVTTLKDERTPLLDHLGNMDKHVKMMYKELLEEAGGNKKLEERISENDDKITDLKKNLKQKNDILSCTKRRIENFEYQIFEVMRNEKFEDWPAKLNEVFSKNFEENSKIDNFIQQGSIIGSSIREIQKDSLLESLEKNVHEAIKDELIRYRDFMSKKLITMTKVNKRIENDRDEIFLKIQNENTNLIIECNRLRKEKHLIKNKWSTLQKSLKEITRELTGITDDSLDLKDEEVDIDEQKFLIQRNISDQRIISQKHKEELPFVKYVNEKKAKLANNAALKEHLSPIKMIEKQPSTHNLFNILINEIEKHNIETVNQGTLIEKLREKVHQFLYIDDPNMSSGHLNTNTLPVIKDNNDTIPISEAGAKSSFHEIQKKQFTGIVSPVNQDKGLKINGSNIILTPSKQL